MREAETTSGADAPATANRPFIRTVATGKTVAEAIRLLPKASSIYVAVPHFGAGFDWSYVRISRKQAKSWLTSSFIKPTDAMWARVTDYHGENTPHLGSVYSLDPEA